MPTAVRIPGAGGLSGPASATDEAVARFDGVTGKLLQNSAVTIDDSGNMSGVGNIALAGVLTINGTFAGTGFLDEDAMGSDAADKVASQQSVKAYVDTEVSSHTHVEADITDLQAYMLNLVDDTSPELGGDLKLAATGVGARSFNFDHATNTLLTIQNVGDGSVYLLVDGSIQANLDLIAGGNIIVSGTVDGVDIAARDHDNEGTALLSTGEGGGTKFLREDGDGTCSWQAAAGGDLVDDLTPQLGADLDCNGFDIQFDNATGIRDDSDNEQLIFQKTSAAVTYFEMMNATAGNAPILSVSGETNVDLKILAKGTGILKLGVAADIGLFASVAYVFGPNENKKAHLGKASKKWDTGHFGGLLDANETGVRGAYYAAALSNPPTDAQLDSGVGAPASLGSGFKVMVKDTTSGNYWFMGTDGTGWYRTAALTVLS